MVNRNNKATLCFLKRSFNSFFHHRQNPSLLPSATPYSRFTLGTGFDSNFPPFHQVSSFSNPFRNFVRTKQLGIRIPSRIIQDKCYGSVAGLVQRNPRFSKLNDDDIRYFEEILGSKNVIQDEEKLITANTDWMRKYKGSSKLLLQPSSTDQVLFFVIFHFHLTLLNNLIELSITL